MYNTFLEGELKRLRNDRLLATWDFLYRNPYREITDQQNIQKLSSIEESLSGKIRKSPSIIKPGRVFVREGAMMKAARKRDQERWFFLFNDLLVYAELAPLEKSVSSRFSMIPGISAEQQLASSTQTGSSFGKTAEKQYNFHRAINLLTTEVRPQATPSSVKDKRERFYLSILTTEEKSFNVYLYSEKERQAWMADLERCIAECKTKDRDLTTASTDVAPVWVQDRDVKNCQVCAKKFSMTTRRHHCRKCGSVVCSECSSFRLKIATSNDKAVRVCSKCWKEAASTPSKANLRETKKSKHASGLLAGGMSSALGSVGFAETAQDAAVPESAYPY